MSFPYPFHLLIDRSLCSGQKGTYRRLESPRSGMQSATQISAPHSLSLQQSTWFFTTMEEMAYRPPRSTYHQGPLSHFVWVQVFCPIQRPLQLPSTALLATELNRLAMVEDWKAGRPLAMFVARRKFGRRKACQNLFLVDLSPLGFAHKHPGGNAKSLGQLSTLLKSCCLLETTLEELKGGKHG